MKVDTTEIYFSMYKYMLQLNTFSVCSIVHVGTIYYAIDNKKNMNRRNFLWLFWTIDINLKLFENFSNKLQRIENIYQCVLHY